MAKTNLSPYDGHDTVGVVSLDQHTGMAAGTSSSGLFMKKQGRVGDSLYQVLVFTSTVKSVVRQQLV